MILKLKDGDVKIKLFPDVAPNHVKRITELADSGKYDGVVFHRVIDGFMAQTGDVQFGNSSSDNFDISKSKLFKLDKFSIPLIDVNGVSINLKFSKFFRKHICVISFKFE